jgi:hypothetical protein
MSGLFLCLIMYFCKVLNPITYQIIDSSLQKDSMVNKDQTEDVELEFIEEIDEPIKIPKPKKYYNKVASDSGQQIIDTFYGISNEELIPIRNIDIINTEEITLKKLFDPNPIYVNVANWQVIILVLAVIMLGIVKAFSSSRFKQSIRALFKFGVAQEITREEKVFFHRSNIIFSFIHLLTTSLFLYHIKEFFGVALLEKNSIGSYFMIMGFIMIIYLLKYLFSKILFFVLDDLTSASEYIFNIALFNNLMGVILIPIMCLIYFSLVPSNILLFCIAIPMVLLTYILRIIRLFLIGSSKGVSFFYIFLYLCSLEILPLVVLFKIFILK